MMFENPPVSLGLPVFNGQDFLKAAIDALLVQTHTAFELIICDNASTDATAEICRRYAAGDRRIRYVRNERNLGAARNYNRCFELASGKYFKWCSHDDVCAPTYLERCLALLEPHPEVVLAYPQTIIIDERGCEVRAYRDEIDLRSGEASERLRALFTRNAGECNAIFGLIRSDVLRRTPLIGNYVASDENLLAELAMRGQIWQVREPLFFRRDHPRTSGRANATLDDVRRWFDSSWSSRIHLPRWRWLLEYVRSAGRVPLGLDERMRIYALLVRWTYWQKRLMVAELGASARALSGAGSRGNRQETR